MKRFLISVTLFFCAASAALAADVFTGEYDEYTHTATTNDETKVVLHTWTGRNHTNKGRAYAVEFIAFSEMRYRFSTVAAEGKPECDDVDSGMFGRPRVQKVSQMMQRLIDQGETPIAAVNGCFFNDYNFFCPYGATICDSRFVNGGMMDINSQRYLVETWDHKLIHGPLVKAESMGAAAIPAQTADLLVEDEEVDWLGVTNTVMKRVRNTMCSYFEFNPYQTLKAGEIDENELETKNPGHARTLAGYTRDRSKFIFFVSEDSGSQWHGGNPVAGQFPEKDQALILKEMGYWEIGHFDGGGSSTLWYRDHTGGYAEDHIVNMANGGAGSERPVASAMVILAPKNPQPKVVAQIPLGTIGRDNILRYTYGDYYDLDEPLDYALKKKGDTLHLVQPVTVDHDLLVAGFPVDSPNSDVGLMIESTRTSPYSAPIIFKNGSRLEICAKTNITKRVMESQFGKLVVYTTNIVDSVVRLKKLIVHDGDISGRSTVHVASNSVVHVSMGFCGDIETEQVSGFHLDDGGITNDIRIVCNEVDRENGDPMKLYFGYVDFTTKGKEFVSLNRLKNPWNDPTIWAVGSNGRLRWALAKARIGESMFETFDEAMAAAKNGDVIEVFRPTEYTAEKTYNLTTITNLTICCSNPDPTTCPIECGELAKIVIGTGARVVFSNVVFRTGGRSLVEFSTGKNGRAAFAGKIGLGSVTLNGEWNHFELAGAIDPVGDGLSVDCRDVYGAPKACDVGEVFGVWSGPDGEQGDAVKLLLAGDDELAGSVDGEGNLVWALTPTTAAEALIGVAYANDAGPVKYFRSMNKAMPYLTNDSVITVYRDIPAARMTLPMVVSRRMTIVSSPAESRFRVTPSAGVKFTVNAGGGLTLQDIVFADFEGECLFNVNGGDMTLGSGAELTNLVGNVSYGPTRLLSGTLTMEPGSKIVGCMASASKSAYGGGIYLTGGKLRLEGGEIRNCLAKSGGGIYVTGTGLVELSGAVVIDGNSIGTRERPTTNDLYVSVSTYSPITITGGMTGAKVGVKFSTDKTGLTGNHAGYYFAEIGDSLSSAEIAALPDAFANQTDPATIYAAVDAESDPKRLVWKTTVLEDGQCAVDDAALMYEYEDGTTCYYPTLDAAFAHINNDCTVTLLRDVTFNEKIPVKYDITLTGGHTVTRGGSENNVILVDGGKLTLKNVTIDGGGLGKVLLAAGQLYQPAGTPVGAGTITLGAGAVVTGVYGGGDHRVACGIFINGNSELVMESGAVVSNCVNTYRNVGQKSGFGAGIYVSGGTARFNGGIVTGCRAFRAAGVFIGQKATAYVGGDFTVTNNADLAAVNYEDMVIEDQSFLYMDAPLTGWIGLTDGIQCNTNLVGYIEKYSDWDETVASNSAACFHQNRRGYAGLVGGSEAAGTQIVWILEGEDPPPVTPVDPPPLPPIDPPDDPPDDPPEDPVYYAEPKPIAFKSIEWDREAGKWHLVITDAVKFCVYRLYATNSLDHGFVIEGVAPVRVDTNKTTAVELEYVVDGDGPQRFWKATAERGVVTTE